MIKENEIWKYGFWNEIKGNGTRRYEMIFMKCMKPFDENVLWSQTMFCMDETFWWKCDKCFGFQTHVAHETLLSYVSFFNAMYLRLHIRKENDRWKLEVKW